MDRNNIQYVRLDNQGEKPIFWAKNIWRSLEVQLKKSKKAKQPKMTPQDFPFLEATLVMEGEVIWRIPSTSSIRTCFSRRFIRADMDQGTLILDLIPYQTTVRLCSGDNVISCNCTGSQSILLQELNSGTILALTIEPNDLQDAMGILTSLLSSTPRNISLSPTRSSLSILSTPTPSKTTSSPGPSSYLAPLTPYNSTASAVPTSLRRPGPEPASASFKLRRVHVRCLFKQ